MATRMPEGVSKRNNDGDSTSGFAIPRSGGIRDAAWRVARSYKPDMRAFAQRMEMPYDTFQKKVSPNCETHHLQLDEVIDLQVFAERYDVLYAMADALGHVCLPVPDEPAADIGLRLMEVGQDVGDVFEVARRVLQDGKVTPAERKELRGKVAEAVHALMSVLKGA